MKLSVCAWRGYCLLQGVIPPDKVPQVRHDIDKSMKAGLEAYEKLGWSAVTHMLSLAPYLADCRLQEIVRAMFNHATVRISQTEFKSASLLSYLPTSLTAYRSRFRPCTPTSGRTDGPYSLFHRSQTDGVRSLAPVERWQSGMG